MAISNLMKITECLQTGRKHCGKRRNCSLRAISPFPTLFSKDLCSRHVKTREMINRSRTFQNGNYKHLLVTGIYYIENSIRLRQLSIDNFVYTCVFFPLYACFLDFRDRGIDFENISSRSNGVTNKSLVNDIYNRLAMFAFDNR